MEAHKVMEGFNLIGLREAVEMMEGYTFSIYHIFFPTTHTQAQLKNVLLQNVHTPLDHHIKSMDRIYARAH
jgi:hypothetical protein